MPPEQNGLSHVSLSHFQDALRRSIGAEAYEQWFAGQVRFSAQAHALTVRVANPYKQAWLQRKFQKQVRDAAAHCALTTLRWEAGDLDAVTGEGIESLIATAGDVARVAPFEVTTEPPRTGATGHTSRAAKTPTRDASLPSQQGQIELAGDTDARSRPAPSVARSTKPPVRGGKTGRGGRPARSFRSFHPGKGNALALTAAQRVCDNPFTTTMLYLHSGVGNGKSHLLEAIEHSLVRKHPELKVLRLAAETFANAFTQALDARSLPSFRQKFRNVDVLLVDDVDFFDGKKSIQEEFLHTLKRLDDAGKLVVLTADRHPRLLSKSSEEFISRCQSGMVCGIDAPSIETRRAAAFSAAQRAELEVRDDALEFVATRFADNVREIEGASERSQFTQRRRRHSLPQIYLR